MSTISPVRASSMAERTLVFPVPFGPCTKMTGALSGTVMVPLMLRKFEIDTLLSDGLMAQYPRGRDRGGLLIVREAPLGRPLFRLVLRRTAEQGHLDRCR